MFNFSVAHGKEYESKTTYFTNVLYFYIGEKSIVVVGAGREERKEVRFENETAIIMSASDRVVEWARANAKEVIDL